MTLLRRTFPALAAVFLACLVLAPAARAQVPDLVNNPLVDRAQAMELAAKATPEAYPNADTVYVDDHTYEVYHADGTYSESYESYVKVLTEAGRRSMTVVTSSFTLPYNTTQFLLVEVIRPDGTVIPVDIEANSQEMIDRSQMDSNIYNPNEKYLRVSIPDLNVGDTVHYVIHDDYAQARVPGAFSEYTCFEGLSPILRSELTIAGPPELPLRHMVVKSEIPGTLSHGEWEEDGLMVHNWVASDVPQAFSEPDMPPMYTQCQRLMVSTIEDWQWLSKWYFELSEPHIQAGSPAIEAKARELVQSIDDPMDKLWAIFTWVSQDVRYLGLTVETESPGYEPHDVAMTFERRAGVCRDKAALLVAMLRAAGFEAYPVLINSGYKVDPDVPMVFFDHAVTAARLPDGSLQLMDPTDESAAEFLPPYLNNKSYLPALPQGDVLRVSPVEPPEEHMMRIATTGRITDQGGIQAETVLSFEGINDSVYRSWFATLTARERQEFFEGRFKELVPGARITEFELTPRNMLDTTVPLSARIAFTAPDLRIPGEEAVLLPVPRLGEGIGMVRLLIGMLGLDERRYPIVTEYVCGVEETLSLTLSPALGEVLSLPEYSTSDTEAVTLYRDMDVENGTLTAVDRFVLKLPEYSPEQYMELKDLARTAETNARAMPIFAPGQTNATDHAAASPPLVDGDPDAVILFDETRVTIEDEHAWTTTRHVKLQVLTYLGTDGYSEIAIDFNPAWEEVHVDQATVTSPTGEVLTIAEHEMNLMDAGWVGDAPRFPAAKTLVASLPGVEAGSVIDVQITRRRFNRPFFHLAGAWIEPDPDYPIQFLDMEGVFAAFAPMGERRLTIDAPETMDLRIDASDAGFGLGDLWAGPTGGVIRQSESVENGRRILEFRAENVPPVASESMLPPASAFLPTVLASAGDWAQYAESLRQALDQAAAPDPAVTALTEEITRGLSAMDKIKAIHDYAARKIRFTGPDLNEHPVDMVFPAGRTLADGYADDADQAALLAAMLRAAGFEPTYVLAGWAPLDPDLNQPLLDHPDPAYFNTVLVRVDTSQGPVYLGDQNQYAVLGSTYYNGRPGLDLSTGELVTIRALSEDYVDQDHMELAIAIQADGSALITERTWYHGTGFGDFRQQYEEMLPEELRRLALNLAAGYGQSARLEGELKADWQHYPGLREFTVRVEDFAVRQGDYLYMKLPGIVGGIHGAEGEARLTPLFRDYLSLTDRRITVTLPPGVASVAVSPPPFLSLDVARGGRVDVLTELLDSAGNVTLDAPRTLRTTQATRLLPMVVLPGEYPLFLEVDRILGHPATSTLCLRMRADTP